MIKFLELLASCAVINSSMSATMACDYIQINTRSNNIFQVLGGYPSPTKDLDCDDGYIIYDFEVLKAGYTNQSNLYILSILLLPLLLDVLQKQTAMIHIRTIF